MSKERMSLLENMDRFEVTRVKAPEEEVRQKGITFSDNILKELTNQNGPYKELTNQEGPDSIEQLRDQKFSTVSRFSPAHNVTIINVEKGPELLDYYNDYFESDTYKVKRSRSLVSKCCVGLALALILILTSVLIVSTILLNVQHGHGHTDSVLSQGQYNLTVSNVTVNNTFSVINDTHS